MCDEYHVAKDIFGNHNDRVSSDNADDCDWTFCELGRTVQRHIAQTPIESRIHADRD